MLSEMDHMWYNRNSSQIGISRIGCKNSCAPDRHPICLNTAYKLLLSLMVIPDVHWSFIPKKPHLLLSGFQSCELWKPLSKAVAGKFNGSGGHSKHNNLQYRVDFHRTRTWQIVLIFDTDILWAALFVWDMLHIRGKILGSNWPWVFWYESSPGSLSNCICCVFVLICYRLFSAIAFTIGSRSLRLSHNRPISQFMECACSISHNAPFRTEMCTFLFWMVHCGIWNRFNITDSLKNEIKTIYLLHGYSLDLPIEKK